MACGNSQKSKQSTDSTGVVAEEKIVPDVPDETGVIEFGDKGMFDLATGKFTCNGVHYDFAFVKGGTFTMGAAANDKEADDDEKPAHKVTLDNYYIGKTEVTWGLWRAVMGSNPPGKETLPDNCPVQNVSWDQCQKFFIALYEYLGLGELCDFCLPTEAEWEFAARGGNKSKHYKYSGSNNLDDVAWYTTNFYKGESDGEQPKVATKKPNELGIYDMSGNVAEWCYDQYAEYTSKSQDNPRYDDMGDFRVLRGGNYLSDPNECRVTRRLSNYCNEEWNALCGFRIVFKHYRQCDDEE